MIVFEGIVKKRSGFVEVTKEVYLSSRDRRVFHLPRQFEVDVQKYVSRRKKLVRKPGFYAGWMSTRGAAPTEAVIPVFARFFAGLLHFSVAVIPVDARVPIHDERARFALEYIGPEDMAYLDAVRQQYDLSRTPVKPRLAEFAIRSKVLAAGTNLAAPMLRGFEERTVNFCSFAGVSIVTPASAVSKAVTRPLSKIARPGPVPPLAVQRPLTITWVNVVSRRV